MYNETGVVVGMWVWYGLEWWKWMDMGKSMRGVGGNWIEVQVCGWVKGYESGMDGEDTGRILAGGQMDMDVGML